MKINEKEIEIKKENFFSILKEILKSDNSSEYFYKLKNENKLHLILQELQDMVGSEHPVKHHAEGDVFEHTMYVLKQTEGMSVEVKFAALFHDIGKPETLGVNKKTGEPTYYGHATAGEEKFQNILDRLKKSNNLTDTDMKLINKMENVARITKDYHHSLRDLMNKDYKIGVDKVKHILKKLSDFSKNGISLESVVEGINADTKGRVTAEKLSEDAELNTLSKQELTELTQKINDNADNIKKEIEYKGVLYKFHHSLKSDGLISSKDLIILIKLNDAKNINELLKFNGKTESENNIFWEKKKEIYKNNLIKKLEKKIIGIDKNPKIPDLQKDSIKFQVKKEIESLKINGLSEEYEKELFYSIQDKLIEKKRVGEDIVELTNNKQYDLESDKNEVTDVEHVNKVANERKNNSKSRVYMNVSSQKNKRKI